jgi:glutamate-ammonia-ligase adenylyltransferase
LRKRATLELLVELAALHLLSPEEAAALRDGYDFLARLENRLRIESDQPAWAVPTNPDALRPLARRMGYDGSAAPQQLLSDLRARREAIRTAFASCFAHALDRVTSLIRTPA